MNNRQLIELLELLPKEAPVEIIKEKLHGIPVSTKRVRKVECVLIDGKAFITLEGN